MSPILFTTVAGLLVAPYVYPVVKVKGGQLHVPIQLRGKHPEEVEAVEVWISDDKGRGWSRVALLPPDAKTYESHNRRNGEYLVGFHIRMKDGSTVPPHKQRPESIIRYQVTGSLPQMGVATTPGDDGSEVAMMRRFAPSGGTVQLFVKDASGAKDEYGFFLGPMPKAKATRYQLLLVKKGLTVDEVETILGERYWGWSYVGPVGEVVTTYQYPSLTVRFGPDGRVIGYERPPEVK